MRKDTREIDQLFEDIQQVTLLWTLSSADLTLTLRGTANQLLLYHQRLDDANLVVFQQRLNPAPPDPMQAKIMMMLPIVFTFLFLFFPSGLVLYWFVNNLLSIAQQWVITRKIVGPDG